MGNIYPQKRIFFIMAFINISSNESSAARLAVIPLRLDPKHLNLYRETPVSWAGKSGLTCTPTPLDWIHYENTFSYVEGYQHNQPDSSRYLPLIPPPRWQSTLRVDIESAGKLFHNIFVQIESDFFFKQDKYYAAYGTETATPRYILFNLGMGTDIVVKGKTLCSFYVSMNNLTDVTYQSHLSRLKYTDINYATNRVGIL